MLHFKKKKIDLISLDKYIQKQIKDKIITYETFSILVYRLDWLVFYVIINLTGFPIIVEINRNDGNHFLNASFTGDVFLVCSVDDKSSSKILFFRIYLAFLSEYIYIYNIT